MSHSYIVKTEVRYSYEIATEIIPILDLVHTPQFLLRNILIMDKLNKVAVCYDIPIRQC